MIQILILLWGRGWPTQHTEIPPSPIHKITSFGEVLASPSSIQRCGNICQTGCHIPAFTTQRTDEERISWEGAASLSTAAESPRAVSACRLGAWHRGQEVLNVAESFLRGRIPVGSHGSMQISKRRSRVRFLCITRSCSEFIFLTPCLNGKAPSVRSDLQVIWFSSLAAALSGGRSKPLLSCSHFRLFCP